MSAYVCVEVNIHDPERYSKYKDMAPPSIYQYGGKYIARGGACETLEGGWSPPRFVILEFENMDRAKAWWASPEYAEAKKLRHATASSKMIVLEGLPPDWKP
ncbi:MAG TPA: DUF1330 domain-containing protein [Gemmatimonadaceae bacterium]|nr:DUF1330 domain-containing protein [Gemmatimonadaceae bacterium]